MENKKIEDTPFRKLIGEWKTEGKILETENSPEMKITGTDTYETILDGFFLLHKAEVMMGNARSETHEIMGFGNNPGHAIMEHYNNQGSSGRMTGHLDNDDFAINGEGLRFKGRFNNDGTYLEGKWERLTDQDKWVDFLQMGLTKRTNRDHEENS